MIGSGINFKRKGLKKLIDLTYSDAKIIIENKEFKQPQQEITEDLIEIITVYSSKLYGSRSYKKEENLSNSIKHLKEV